MDVFFILAAFFALFVLWLCSKIVAKAGLDRRWVLCLLIPVINVIMVWVFAFVHWPKARKQ